MDLIDQKCCSGCDFITPLPYTMTRMKDFYWCKRTMVGPVIDLVTGEEEYTYKTCVHERSDAGSCGPTGKHWKNEETLKRNEEWRKRTAQYKEQAEKRKRNWLIRFRGFVDMFFGVY